MRFEELKARERDCHRKGQSIPEEERSLLDALQAEMLSDDAREQSLKTVRAGKRVLDLLLDETGAQRVQADCHRLAKHPPVAKAVVLRHGEIERKREREQ
jgi:hypothetical protein